MLSQRDLSIIPLTGYSSVRINGELVKAGRLPPLEGLK
jgi:hypothetical protein